MDLLRRISRLWVKPPALMVLISCAFLVGMSGYRAGVDGCERDLVGHSGYDGALAHAYVLVHGEFSLLPEPRTSSEQDYLLDGVTPAGRSLAQRDYEDFRREAKLRPVSAMTDLLYSEVVHASNLGFWSDLPIRFAQNSNADVMTDAAAVSVVEGTSTAPPVELLAETVEDKAVDHEAAEVDLSVSAQMGPPVPAGFTPVGGLDEHDTDIVTAFVGPPAPTDLSSTAPGALSEEKRRLPFDPLRVGPFIDVEPHNDMPTPRTLAAEHLHTVPLHYEIAHRIKPNQTVSDVLDEHGISPQDADDWITAARKAYNLNRVYVGQKLSFRVHGPTGKLSQLVLEIGSGSNLVVERRDKRIVSRREDIELERKVRVVSGTIKSSLYMAAVAKGVPDKVVSDIAEILGWEIDFSRDLRPGAGFKVTYEELSREGSERIMAGRVLSVEIENRSKRHEGFFFADEKAAIKGYFNRKGDGLGRFFLRYPVSFSRISSHFSNKRFHPVLKRSRPHYGVDFAASTGTPVKAVADGKVVKAGWHGGNGRFVKIRHGRTYETGYAHLSRIAASTRLGGWIKKGQVIGYVGSSGLATGPHLHFAMYKNGTYIDPLKANLPRTESLSGANLMAHKLTISATEEAYAKAEADPAGSALLASLPKL